MEALLVLMPFAASLLTFFSGFGLGTLLTPVFVLFFPVELALLMTASVHLTNNVFKFALLIRSVERKTLFSFALWAVPGAFLGARATVGLGQMSAWHFSETWTVGPLPSLIGCLMIVFTLMEFWPAWNRFAWTGRWFYTGGFFSGFFGGLSGHQGALRSLFLKKLDLSPMSFVATGTAIALLIDLSRIPIYWQDFGTVGWQWKPVLIASASAICGALLGKRMLKKVRWVQMQRLVGLFLLLMGIALISGKIS